MKYKWDKKYLYWGSTLFIVLALGILFNHILSHFNFIQQWFHMLVNILQPVIYGFIIAYLLTPIINFWERRAFFPLYIKLTKTTEADTLSPKIKKRFRSISICISIIMVFLILYELLYLLLPQLISSISSIIFKMPSYFENFQTWILELIEKHPDIESTTTSMVLRISDYFADWLSGDLLPRINQILTYLSNSVLDFIMVIKNLFIGIIISIYILSSKELFAAQGKKVLYSLLKPQHANHFISSLRYTNAMFGGFISGKLVDSLIIGIICLIGTSCMNIPYAVLVSIIIGVTNIIPFFGPYIGSIPCAFLILLISPIHCVYFIIFVIILQTFDGNILGPKILGNSTNLSSFWVIFAILIGGGLFGIVGMFVGVPVFAVIYAGIKTFINRKLVSKNMSVLTKDYIDIDFYPDTDGTMQAVSVTKQNTKRKEQESKKHNSKIKKTHH